MSHFVIKTEPDSINITKSYSDEYKPSERNGNEYADDITDE